MTILDRVSAYFVRRRTPTKVPAPDAPLTIEALHGALARLSDERDRRLADIDQAEAEREAILDAVDGDDAQVLAVDGRIALARVAIERLERLEREAVEQLAPLELSDRQRRWSAAAAEYVTMMRDVHAAMELYEIAANALWASRSALFNPISVVNWDSQVPRLPQFTKATPAGPIVTDSFAYGQEIEHFARSQAGEFSVGRARESAQGRTINPALEHHQHRDLCAKHQSRFPASVGRGSVGGRVSVAGAG